MFLFIPSFLFSLLKNAVNYILEVLHIKNKLEKSLKKDFNILGCCLVVGAAAKPPPTHCGGALQSLGLPMGHRR